MEKEADAEDDVFVVDIVSYQKTVWIRVVTDALKE